METENCCTGCNRPDLPWAGRGTELPIAGCRFTLYPMSDKYIEIILGSLEKTNTSAVWSETDALSTVYRGKLPYVADAVQALQTFSLSTMATARGRHAIRLTLGFTHQSPF